jgi:hypothetical protein
MPGLVPGIHFPHGLFMISQDGQMDPRHKAEGDAFGFYTHSDRAVTGANLGIVTMAASDF